MKTIAPTDPTVGNVLAAIREANGIRLGLYSAYSGDYSHLITWECAVLIDNVPLSVNSMPDLVELAIGKNCKLFWKNGERFAVSAEFTTP